jgi:hypothetical protein
LNRRNFEHRNFEGRNYDRRNNESRNFAPDPYYTVKRMFRMKIMKVFGRKRARPQVSFLPTRVAFEYIIY